MTLNRSLLYLYGTVHARRVVGVSFKNGDLNRSQLLTCENFFQNGILRTIKTSGNRTPKIRVSVASKSENLANKEFGGRPLTMTMLWKPLIFTISFSAGTFAACAIWQYESIRKKSMSLMKSSKLWNGGSIFWQTTKKYSWREELNKKWNNLTDAETLFGIICVANIIVHLAWKVPKFEITMIRYFCSNPNSRAVCWPLVLSTFSHCSTIHLAMNMYALNGFSVIGINSMGKEQFLGLYLVGGAISSFISLFFRVLRKKPNLSLGASGAIFGIIGYIAVKYPNLKLTIIGLPICTFTAATALKTLIAFDLMGLLMGWKFLDHAAHLGGAFCGIFWFYWGNANIWQRREALVQRWHELRNAVK